MAKYVADTHAFIWFLDGDRKLAAKAKAAMVDPSSEVILPAIALAEVLWIVTTRTLTLTIEDVQAAIENDPRIIVFPLTHEIVEYAHTLTSIPEMHDRQIAATAIMLDSPDEPVILLTRDASIVASGIVRTAW